jgi:hypothetical protein
MRSLEALPALGAVAGEHQLRLLVRPQLRDVELVVGSVEVGVLRALLVIGHQHRAGHVAGLELGFVARVDVGGAALQQLRNLLRIDHRGALQRARGEVAQGGDVLEVLGPGHDGPRAFAAQQRREAGRVGQRGLQRLGAGPGAVLDREAQAGHRLGFHDGLDRLARGHPAVEHRLFHAHHVAAAHLQAGQQRFLVAGVVHRGEVALDRRVAGVDFAAHQVGHHAVLQRQAQVLALGVGQAGDVAVAQRHQHGLRRLVEADDGAVAVAHRAADHVGRPDEHVVQAGARGAEVGRGIDGEGDVDARRLLAQGLLHRRAPGGVQGEARLLAAVARVHQHAQRGRRCFGGLGRRRPRRHGRGQRCRQHASIRLLHFLHLPDIAAWPRRNGRAGANLRP